MARVFFTSNLRRHVDCATADAAGATVGDVLASVFASQSGVRHYVLDDQGALRKHMMILIDGQRVRDRDRLSDPVKDSSQIYVMQALSGG